MTSFIVMVLVKTESSGLMKKTSLTGCQVFKKVLPGLVKGRVANLGSCDLLYVYLIFLPRPGAYLGSFFFVYFLSMAAPLAPLLLRPLLPVYFISTLCLTLLVTAIALNFNVYILCSAVTGSANIPCI